MKTALNYLVLALAAASLSTFTACKKAEEAPATPDPAPAPAETPAETPAEPAPAAE